MGKEPWDSAHDRLKRLNEQLGSELAALRESEARYRLLAEQSPAGVVVIQAGQFKYVNPALIRMMGFSQAELLSAPSVLEFVIEEDRALVRENLRRREKGEAQSIDYSFRVRRKDGYPLDFEVFGARCSFQGRPAVTSVVLDVTEQKRTAAALRKSENLYRALFENMIEGYAHCKMLFDGGEPQDFLYITVNDAFEQLTGLKNVVGKKVSEVIPGIKESNPELFKIYGRVALTGKPERFETHIKSLGIWLSVSVYGPAKEHFIAVFENITERKQSEAALRESEESYRVITNSVTDVIVAIDQKSQLIRFANDSLLRTFGYSPAELLGKEITVLMPERYRDAHRAGLKRYMDTGVKHLNWQATPAVGLHKNGKEVPLEVAFGEYAKGAERYFVGVLRDATQLRRAEEALRLFRTLIDRSNDIIEVVDPETGRFFDVNETGCLKLGYSREEFLAMSVFDIDPMVDQSSFTRAVAELRKSGVLLLEGAHRRKDGSTFPVEVNISLAQLDREYAVAVVRDITERKWADAELREARDRLQQAVTAGGVGLWDRDLRTNHVYYSPEWKRQIGYADDEISDDFNEWQRRLHPEDRKRALQTIETVLAGAAPNVTLEFRFQHKDNSFRHILARISLLRDNLGQPVRMLGSHLDITELKNLQQQFLQAQKMESVGRLAGGIAHDFNNLLTVINGISDLELMKLREDDPLYAVFKGIHRAGDRAASLTRQLLAFSRRQIMKSEVLNLNTVLADMQNMLRRLVGEDININFERVGSLGSVRADPGQVEQVVVNLVVNARDAMPNGGMLTLETRDVEIDEAHAAEHPSVQPGPHVMLAISDTGVGMDEATRARIFEPFFTTKGEGKGTGLGLSTVYGIVKQSSGSIWVYSEIGRGTTFKIYFPRVNEVAREDRPVQPTALAGGFETILIVEDDAGLRDLAGRILRSAGYTVLTAGNGGEALMLVERHDGTVHMMLTDVVMPGMSGRDLAARFADIRPQMKVLYTSGYTDDAILRHGVLDEGVHFIHKPYAAAELTRKVREVLDTQDSSPKTG